jgi:H+/Cl- antiporter ClcA
MFVETVNAYTQPGWAIFSQNMEFWDFVLLIISIFVLVSWILSILFILYGWLLLILSWWKEDKIKPAINTIRYAVLGLVITVAAIFVFPIFWRLLWIDVDKYAKPSRILEKIEELWNNIFHVNSNQAISPTTNNIDELNTDDFVDDF